MKVKLNFNSSKFSTAIKWSIVAKKSKNPIMIFFLIRLLIYAYKIPYLTLIKTKLNINRVKKNSMKILLSNFLTTRFIFELLFKIKYRYYSFKEQLFIRKLSMIEIIFFKLPNNKQLRKLETIETGESINFKFGVLGRYTYLEIIYILNHLGLTNIHEACNIGGLDYENVIFRNKDKIDMKIFFKLASENKNKKKGN